MKLVYSEDAVGDLIRLRSFITEHDPTAAGRVAAELLQRLENLPLLPAMGNVVVGTPIAGTIREIAFGDYVVRYMPRETVVIVLRIWHHFEDR